MNENIELTEWDEEALDVYAMMTQFETFVYNASPMETSFNMYIPTLIWALGSLQEYYEDEIIHGRTLVEEHQIDLGDWVQTRLEE